MKASDSGEENSEGNKASKPKDHCKEFCGQNAEFMRRCFEADRGDCEVRECEDCPHGAKEEEVCFGGRTCVVWYPVAHDVGHEAQDDDAKDCLSGAEWEGVVEGHGELCRLIWWESDEERKWLGKRKAEEISTDLMKQGGK
jgi:hypothetical protein